MINYIIANLSTIIVGSVLLAAIATAVTVIIRDKKKHRNLCGYSCQGCPMAEQCQQKDSQPH